jgi:uncharacterized phage protein gp47/JayE
MADLYNYVEPSGVIVTDAGVVLNQVNDEYKNAFGSDLITPDSLNPQGASTPQGLLIVMEALSRIAVADNNAMLANQINPNVSGGIFLDAILSLTGSARTPATPSLVTATLNGVVGTIIPMGSQASDNINGNVFQTTEAYTIPTGGILTGAVFESVENGAIPCDADALTNIISSVLGWELISSNTAAVLGQLTQSDVSARAMRINEIGIQGSSIAAAIYAAVTQAIIANPPASGVGSLTFLENATSSPATIEGVSMVANSIYVCVNGGTNGTFSTVTATLTGTPATSVAAGSQASSNGFVFKVVSTVIIGGGGTVDADFIAVSTGAIPCPPGTLTTIVTPVVGWASVTNADAGVSGTESTIALALISKKSAGASYNNGPGVNISAIVQEPTSSQYLTVLYDNPNPISVNVLVNIKVITPVQDPQTSVANAILNYVAGGVSGIPGLDVGQNVSAFEISGAIATQLPGIYIQSLYIALAPTVPSSSAEISIADYEIASILTNNIQVIVI